jgi:DNA-directed RNA polymerase specialized sigma24 family protein
LGPYDIEMVKPAIPEVVVGPGFVAFVRDVEPKLRRALVAGFGADIGREATAEALAYGWEHWERLRLSENPAGYLYRVGQSWARRRPLRRVLFPDPSPANEPWVEPGLGPALRALSLRQRQAVVLVHAMGLSQAETATMLGLKPTSVQNHLQRGLSRLRIALGVNDET